MNKQHRARVAERFGSRVRAYRLRKGLLAGTVAARAGIGPWGYSRIEHGRFNSRGITLATLVRLAHALETTPARLIGPHSYKD